MNLELRANQNHEPQLFPYEEKPLEAGRVRVRSLFGAPKHGTEMAFIKPGEDTGEHTYYDYDELIFKSCTPAPEPDSAPKLGMGLGNMWVGEITALGEDVTGFSVGSRVAGYGHLATTHDADPAGLLSMPDTMSWKEAVCYDPLQFALSGVRDAQVRVGDAVLVSGLGAIGQMAAQVAKLSGASLVAVSDPIEIRRKMALDNGADIAFDPTKEDFGLILRGMTNGKGVDAVIETSASYIALEQCIRALSYMGNMALVGFFHECRFPLNLGKEGHMNQQNVFFSRACSEPNRDYPRWDFARICRECWKLLTDGKIRCENIIHPVVDFAESDKGYKRYIMDNPRESIKMGVKF